MDILFDPLSWIYAEQCWLFWGRREAREGEFCQNFTEFVFVYEKR